MSDAELIFRFVRNTPLEGTRVVNNVNLTFTCRFLLIFIYLWKQIKQRNTYTT